MDIDQIATQIIALEDELDEIGESGGQSQSIQARLDQLYVMYADAAAGILIGQPQS